MMHEQARTEMYGSWKRVEGVEIEELDRMLALIRKHQSFKKVSCIYKYSKANWVMKMWQMRGMWESQVL